MVNTEKNRRIGSTLKTSWLLAACVTASIALVACDSAANDASKKAAQAADRAARTEESAGQLSAKPTFGDAFANKNESEPKRHRQVHRGQNPAREQA